MAEQRVQRRLAAILVADVVGYSRLMEADETGTRARLRSLHSELIDRRVAASPDADRARRSMARQVPLGRIAAPDEVAHMILYLISDDSAFVTGAEMVIDGGVTAQ